MTRATGGFAAALCLALFPGCADRQVYDAMQKHGLAECRQLTGPRYERCIEAYGEPYDDYRRALEQARETR